MDFEGLELLALRLEDVFVPSERTFNMADSPREEGPLYVMPMLLLFASGFACTALGVARSALNAAVELAGGKHPRFDQNLLRDKPIVQREIGRAEAIWGSARAFLLEAATAAWAGACQVPRPDG